MSELHTVSFETKGMKIIGTQEIFGDYNSRHYTTVVFDKHGNILNTCRTSDSHRKTKIKKADMKRELLHFIKAR